MKAILGILAFIFFFIVLLVLLTGSYLLSAIRKFRKAAEQAAEQQAHQYREETGRQRSQYNFNARTQQTQTTQQTQQPAGETIIDNRQPRRGSKKIFEEDEGEYVEFTEE